MHLRNKQIKNTVRTAGFPTNRFKGFGGKQDTEKSGYVDEGMVVANLSTSQKLVAKLNFFIIHSNQVQMKLGRNKQPRLTFMYHNQDSNYSRDNDTYRQQNSNQQSYRQSSHR